MPASLFGQAPIEVCYSRLPIRFENLGFRRWTEFSGATPGSYPHIRHRRLGRTRVQPGLIKWKGQPPLVILHGLFGSSRNWASVARRLGAGSARSSDNGTRPPERRPSVASHRHRAAAEPEILIV